MEFDDYVDAGRIASLARREGKKMVNENVKILEVAEYLEDFIRSKGANIAFPVNLSINNEAAHFTPPPGYTEVFKQGDLVKIDLGTEINGCIADTAETVEVSTNKWNNLIKASSEALENAIKKVRIGAYTSEIGREIERTIKKYGYNPIYNLTGHSLERYVLHAGISFPNYDDGSRIRLYPGMAFAIEPFSTTGPGRVRGLEFGNILLILKNDGRDYLSKVHQFSRGLPFSTRDMAKNFTDWEEILKDAEKNKLFYFYPVLKEGKNEMVAQTEHTIYLREDGPVVTTL